MSGQGETSYIHTNSNGHRYILNKHSTTIIAWKLKFLVQFTMGHLAYTCSTKNVDNLCTFTSANFKHEVNKQH